MSYTKGKLKTVKPTTGNPEIDNYWLDIVSDKGVNIATAYIDDAKRIVHCVNNYDGLVEALKEIAKDGCPADIEIAKQTLAKAEEE